jgi:hypothetical protein
MCLIFLSKIRKCVKSTKYNYFKKGETKEFTFYEVIKGYKRKTKKTHSKRKHCKNKKVKQKKK